MKTPVKNLVSVPTGEGLREVRQGAAEMFGQELPLFMLPILCMFSLIYFHAVTSCNIT